jgi:glycogen operon protein
VRRFLKGDEGMAGEMATRVQGSPDLYGWSGRGTRASINFITCHDGFTLNDLVSYNEKHNEANQEDNRDGSNENYSWNCGTEGPTDDPNIQDLRDRQMRNMLTTLLLSQGVPMICAGDEIARTQGGNNNAYCQDNEISWLDWNLDDRKKTLLKFTRFLIELRRKHPNFHRRKFFQDRKISPATVERQQVNGSAVQDVAWYRPDGQVMTEEEWHAGWVRCLGLRLSGRTLNDVNRFGDVVRDDSFLLCINPHHEHIQFYLPPCVSGYAWEALLDTREAERIAGQPVKNGDPYDMAEHSAVLFCEVEAKAEAKQQKQTEEAEMEPTLQSLMSAPSI